jgi:hypothetical protein
MPMTDQELAEFLGIADDEKWPDLVANLTPEKRKQYDALSDAAFEVDLWQKGVLPKPQHILID